MDKTTLKDLLDRIQELSEENGRLRHENHKLKFERFCGNVDSKESLEYQAVLLQKDYIKFVKEFEDKINNERVVGSYREFRLSPEFVLKRSERILDRIKEINK